MMTFTGTTVQFSARPAEQYVVDDAGTKVWADEETLRRIDWGPGAQGCPTELMASPPSATPYGVMMYTCTYDHAGPHYVNVDPVVENVDSFNASLVSIDDWGDAPIRLMMGSFRYTPNLQALPPTLPPTVVTLDSLFRGAPVIPDDIRTWNVSNVSSMNNMFHDTGRNGAAVAPDITGWRTPSLRFANSMFTNAVFNQAIGSWGMGSLESARTMFYGSTFNQPIGGWGMGSARDLTQMLGSSPFNQPIGGWNVGNVTNMNSMFQGNVAFNQDIGNWDVQNVTDMASMFSGATAFNQDITRWEVGKVVTMASMFNLNSKFNQDIGTKWKPVSLESLQYAFNGTTALRSDFSSWRPVMKASGDGTRAFQNSGAVGDLRCWDVSGVSAPTNFNAGAPGITPPLWGQAVPSTCTAP